MITELIEKVNAGIAGHGRDLFFVALVALVAFASFGLGRLSALQQVKTPIRVDQNQTASEIGLVTTGADTTPATSTQDKPSTSQTPPPAPTKALTAGAYVASKNGSVYHLPTCPGAKQIKDANKIWFQTKQDAEAAGYKPAGNCPGLAK